MASAISSAILALTTPHSPVALICPPDLLEQEIDATPVAVNAPRLAALDEPETRRFAAFLAKAKHPALIAAEDVHWSDASVALEVLARTLRAPVYAAPYTGVLPVSSAGSCYAGYLPPSMKQIAERLAPHDALLFVGGRGFRTTLYSDTKLPQRKAWLGNDPAVMASDGEFELACVAPVATSNSPTCGRVKLLHPRRRDEVTLFG